MRLPLTEAFRLTQERGERFAALALRCIQQPYPYAPAHVVRGPEDVRDPRAMHPSFYGCFDWHSAVHGHWLLVRVLRRFPRSPIAAEIRGALGANLAAEHLLAEAAYFAEPGRASFERTYGWAWLLKLAEELAGWEDDQAPALSAGLAPLAALIERRYLDFLPRQTYPIRAGTHPNTAFGLAFALDYARALGRRELAALVEQRSRDYFLLDASAPAGWEPGGNDFFSPSLMEADLMRRVLPSPDFGRWLNRFLSNLRAGYPPALFTPAVVADRADGQLVHLDGLNLSRAWCMWSIAAALPTGDARRDVLTRAAERHAAAGLTGIDSGDYMGDHWLATFALMMLECAPQP
jgi:hypothetical protein